MKFKNLSFLLITFFLFTILISCKYVAEPSSDDWRIDFFDDFNFFNENNWQDQRIWVNNETHCYVPNGEFNTREVSDGTLKLRVVEIENKISDWIFS